MNSEGYVTEIPSYLKQLARLIARGFFQIEDSLIIDMLVRNVCMKEKELEELLKFDAKMIRSRLTTLKSEKFVQTRLRMETGADGKAQKVNYYFINYKNLVNVIKYKLDHMRKRMETQERDATNRASFKCPGCDKTFTDLEAGELYDPTTNNFYCTFCRTQVEEDETNEAPKDSRLLLARFNEELHIVFELLRKAENLKLAPELLDPEPPRGFDDGESSRGARDRFSGVWSGEATRSTEGTRIDVSIRDDLASGSKEGEGKRKERPVWMTESTISDNYGNKGSSSTVTSEEASSSTSAAGGKKGGEDMMSVLLAYESKPSSSKALLPPEDGGNTGGTHQGEEPDSEEEDFDNIKLPEHLQHSKDEEELMETGGVEDMDEDGDDGGDTVLVTIGTEKIPLDEVTEEYIAKMTPEEKEAYVQQYQEAYNYD